MLLEVGTSATYPAERMIRGETSNTFPAARDSTRQREIETMPQSADALTFLRAWLTNPLRVGAAIPSSQHLAALITRHVHPGIGPVIELGPGTGVFTEALIRRGVRQQDLTLVELGDEFGDMLAQRYPQATIVRADAARLSMRNLPQPKLHGAAISGLPLLAMPASKVLRILAGAFSLLEPKASFFQFTYGWRNPVPESVLRRLDLKVEMIGTEFRNFPPASVYRIGRRAIPSLAGTADLPS
jgi:phosphatidylethanolamine/phosphatidyl-N-methylethanolamine N-methyltransferase